MKIEGNELQSKLSIYKASHVTGPNLDEAKSNKGDRATVQQDRVDFSDRGRLMAEAQKAMASVPDVRESLVSRIKTEVENGTYQVDHQKAAGGILREAMTNLRAMG